MRKILLILIALCGFMVHAQVKIGDNPTTIGASSSLELESTDKALVVTRVANTAAIANPVNGMVIYDISSQCIKSYENGAWTNCLSNGSNIEPSTNGSAVVSSYNCSTASAGTLNVGIEPVEVTQTITAQVTRVGTYNLSAIVNGIAFTASGTFSSTGPKDIVLTAAGSPVLSGAHNFVINTVPTCNFSRNVIDLSSNGTAGISAFTCATASLGTLNAGIAATGVTQTITATVTIPGTYSISTTTANGVTFSGSGTVAAGTQDIILTAAGTPTAAVSGTYTLNTTPDCSFDRTAVQISSGGTAIISNITNCTSSSVGTMTANTEIPAGSVTQSIVVTVTTAGSYNITASAVNGITWSASGNLVVGTQTIILKASGTPLAAGTNSFAIGITPTNASPTCTSFTRSVGEAFSAASCPTSYAITGSQVVTVGSSSVTVTNTGGSTTLNGPYCGITMGNQYYGPNGTTANYVFSIPVKNVQMSVLLLLNTNRLTVTASLAGVSVPVQIVKFAGNCQANFTATQSGNTAFISTSGSNSGVVVNISSSGPYDKLSVTYNDIGSSPASGYHALMFCNATAVPNATSNGSAVVSAYSCSGTSVGTMTAGTAVSGVTQTIAATVTTAGGYNITTAPVNGITWSGSGTIAAGAQNIVLTASGTPVSTGAYEFTLPTMGEIPGCTFTRNVGESYTGTVCPVAYGTYPQTVTIGSSTVSVTKTGTDSGSPGYVSQCGVSTSGSSVRLMSAQSVTYAFGVPLKNVQVYGSQNENSQSDAYVVTAFLGTAPVPVQLSKLGGNCQTSFTSSQSGNSGILTATSGTVAIVFNISAASAYDKLTIARTGIVGGLNDHSLMFCNATAVPNTTSGGSAVVSAYSCSTATAGNLNMGITAAGVTQTVTATVTTAGSYSISTTAVDGITFYGSGTFTGTGAQDVILTASGTPTSVGSKTFALITTPDCSFDRTVGNSPTTNGTAVVSAYSCATGTAGSMTQGTAVSGVTQTITATVTTAGTYDISTTANGVTFANAGTLAAGSHPIVLTATGTPTAAGTAVAFALNTTVATCSFNRAINSITSGGSAIVSAYSAGISTGTMTAGTVVSGVTQNITATVTTGGTYNISVAANGVTFAASGTFSGTGNQNIILTATGIPTAAETTNFVLPTTPNTNFNRIVSEVFTTTACSTVYGSYPQTLTVGASSVTVTKTGTGGGTSSVTSECGVTGYTGNSYYLDPGLTATYNFSVPLKNVQVIGTTYLSSAFTVTASLGGVAVPVELVKYGAYCQSEFTSTQSGNNGTLTRGGSGGNYGAVLFNISASGPYDKISITYSGGAVSFNSLMFCNATAMP